MVDRNIEVRAGSAPEGRETALGGIPLASALSTATDAVEEIHLLSGGVAHVKDGSTTSISFVPYRSVAWVDLSTAKSARRSTGIVRIVAPAGAEALPSLDFPDPEEASAFYARLLAAMA